MPSFKTCCNGLQFQRLLLYLSGLRHALLFSTETTQTARGRTKTLAALSMADYLVNSLGFSREQAISTSTKSCKFLKSEQNANSVIGFLRKSGFDDTQIQNAILHLPSLLNNDVEETLTPKIRAFRDLGLSGSFIVNLLASNPQIMRRDVKSSVLLKMKLLKSILGSGENVGRAIKGSTWLLSGNNIEQLQENIILLQKYGLSSERVKKLVLLYPKCLLYSSELLGESLVKVEEMMGIKPESAMFIYAIPVMLMCGKEGLRSKYEVFKSYGWTETDIAILARKQPVIFRYSAYVLGSKLNFLMKELGYQPEYIIQCLSLLTLSLENRIVPRAAVFHLLKAKKLLKTNLTLYTVLCFNETRFLNELVLPYKDLLPQIYHSYLDKRICSLTEAGN
ncbi:hypothetical protein Dimus_009281 [Dionaea muscipula]